MTVYPCSRCNSPDTVGYWSKVPDHYLAPLYPDARKCMDCGHVQIHKPTQSPLLALVERGEFRGSHYTITYKPEGDE